MNKPTLDGLTKADVIGRVIDRSVAEKAWRSACERDALAYVQSNEKARRPDVIAVIRERYDAAGAGFSGRWQS